MFFRKTAPSFHHQRNVLSFLANFVHHEVAQSPVSALFPLPTPPLMYLQSDPGNL